MEGESQSKTSAGSPSAKVLEVFDHVASAAERLGIPSVTFAAGAIALYVSIDDAWIVQCIAAALIVAALGTYVWLTSRSTIRVVAPPAPIPVELQEQLRWMREQIESQGDWLRQTLRGTLQPSSSDDGDGRGPGAQDR